MLAVMRSLKNTASVIVSNTDSVGTEFQPHFQKVLRCGACTLSQPWRGDWGSRGCRLCRLSHASVSWQSSSCPLPRWLTLLPRSQVVLEELPSDAVNGQRNRGELLTFYVDSGPIRLHPALQHMGDGPVSATRANKLIGN